MRRETVYYLLVTEQAKSYHCVMFTTPDSFTKDHGYYAGQSERLTSLFLVVFFSTYSKHIINNTKKTTKAHFYIAL